MDIRPLALLPLLPALVAPAGCISQKRIDAAVAKALAEQRVDLLGAEGDDDDDTTEDEPDMPVELLSMTGAWTDSSVPNFERDGTVPYGENIPAEALYGLYGVAPGGPLTGDALLPGSGQALLEAENVFAEDERRPFAYAIYRTNEMGDTTGLGVPMDGQELLDPDQVPVGERANFAVVAMIPAGWTGSDDAVPQIAYWCLEDPGNSILETDFQWNPSDIIDTPGGNPKWRGWIGCSFEEEGPAAVAAGYRLGFDGEWHLIGQREFNVVSEGE